MRINLLASICLLAVPLVAGNALARQEQNPTPPMVQPSMPMPPTDQTRPADPATPADPAMPGMPGERAMPADPATPAQRADPAMPGMPGQAPMMDSMMPPPPQGQASYPLCSAAIQDQCMNPSEAPRSMRQSRRRAGKRG